MKIIEQKLDKCNICNKLFGFVIENDNGEVQVVCSCVDTSRLTKFMISTISGQLTWGRGSKYFDENKKLIYKQRNF